MSPALEFQLLKIRSHLLEGKAYFILSSVGKIFQIALDNQFVR